MRAPSVTGYAAVRAHTEALAAPLSPEDQTVQSMPDVSPTKWHRAHTTWFFETFVLDRHVVDESYGYLFNSYYEGVGPRHTRNERGLITRPGVAEVTRYRELVDEAMSALLATGADERTSELVELGLHHEQQHQELLLMDIKHVLSVNPLRPAYGDDEWRGGDAGPVQWLGNEGGLVEVGHDGGGFAFDNESPRHRVWLEPFEMADRLVTCGEWLDFMMDDGYHRPELWLSDGWAAVQANGWEAPLYWEPVAGWQVFTMGGMKPVDHDEPVRHVSYYEADAFARWAGGRLPTEAEWEIAGPLLRQRDDECWQWTASDYAPYPGFTPAAGAVGEYNGKFMVGQHVLRGGCRFTPPGHARMTYRNFFPPPSRWAMTGVRLAR